MKMVELYKEQFVEAVRTSIQSVLILRSQECHHQKRGMGMTRILLGLIVYLYLYLLVVLGIATIGQTYAFYNDEERVSGVINIGTWESVEKNCLIDNCGDCGTEQGLKEYGTECKEAIDLESKVEYFPESSIEESAIPEDAIPDISDIDITPHSDGVEEEVEIKGEMDEELQPIVKGNE